METRLRYPFRTGIAVALAALLAGCDDGGGRVLELYFGSNGRGTCDVVTVEVDLDAAGAVLERRGDDADCGLDALLEQSGCSAIFDENGSGNDLTATITGCTIPAVSNLFDCGFTDVDLAELAGVIEARCTCADAGCSPFPPLCVDEDADPGSCEFCDNGEDDDGNGLVDCEDPNCEFASACPPPSTTTTTTSSSSTTNVPGSTMPSTTITSTTSTTLPPIRCEIAFGLPDDVNLGSLQWSVGYADASMVVIGEGATTECAPLVPGVLAAFNDVGIEKRLEAAMVSLDGIDGPTTLAHCLVLVSAVPTPADFVINVLEASTTELLPIEPPPGVVVHTIDCDPGDGPSSTTTTTTTSSTVPEPLQDFSVLFRLESASTGLGAIQFDVDYEMMPGSFPGVGASVRCDNKLLGSLFAPNDDDADRRLSLGLISLTPVAAPVDLVECTFRTAEQPAAQDFQLTVVDATDVDGVPATVEVSATVTPKP